MKVLTVTGYKAMELQIFGENDERIKYIKYALKQQLIPLIEAGLEWVLVSGQSGIETWAAEVVLELKETYPVKLGLFPTFENQASRWPDHAKERYELMQLEADHYKPLYVGNYRGPYQFKEKDKWFVEKSDASLIVMDHEHPGSVVYYHQVAEDAADHELIYITPLDLDDAVHSLQMMEES